MKKFFYEVNEDTNSVDFLVFSIVEAFYGIFIP